MSSDGSNERVGKKAARREKKMGASGSAAKALAKEIPSATQVILLSFQLSSVSNFKYATFFKDVGCYNLFKDFVASLFKKKNF